MLCRHFPKPVHIISLCLTSGRLLNMNGASDKRKKKLLIIQLNIEKKKEVLDLIDKICQLKKYR